MSNAESKMKIAIIGIVGIPANYGGFETLVENLVKYHHTFQLQSEVTVYCSGRNYIYRESNYLSAKLKYIPIHANGVQSIFYDIVSLFSALWNRNDVILLLGVSGAIALPFVRIFSSARIITNIDGIEWRRGKWRGMAKFFLRFSEKMAVRFSHELIADNGAIADYVKKNYGMASKVVAYGGDHAIAVKAEPVDEYRLPGNYSFSVCRIEPENNVHMILESFSRIEKHALVMVGNWNNSEYGCALRQRYARYSNIVLLDPIYDLGKLKTLRTQAIFYIHGHSAGGTNPSLVEAMHFGRPVLAFDCDFNQSSTEGQALFFSMEVELMQLVETTDATLAATIGGCMMEIARRRYTWSLIAKQYFDLIDNNIRDPMVTPSIVEPS